MERIDRTVSKLRMLGAEILELNSFAVYYRLNGLKCLQVYNNDDIICSITDGKYLGIEILNVQMSKHFVAVEGTVYFLLALFADSYKKSLINTIEKVSLHSHYEFDAKSQFPSFLEYTGKLLLITVDNKVYAINNRGREVELKRLTWAINFKVVHNSGKYEIYIYGSDRLKYILNDNLDTLKSCMIGEDKHGSQYNNTDT